MDRKSGKRVKTAGLLLGLAILLASQAITVITKGSAFWDLVTGWVRRTFEAPEPPAPDRGCASSGNPSPNKAECTAAPTLAQIIWPAGCEECAENVAVREGPGKRFRPVASLVRGSRTLVVIIGTTENGRWVKVRFRPNQTGWIARMNVAIVTPARAATASAPSCASKSRSSVDS